LKPGRAVLSSVVDLSDPQTVGYGLVALGVLMFLLEASMPGFFIGVPATILVLLGVFALVAPDFDLFTKWAPLITVLVGVPATFVSIWAYRKMAPPDQEPTTQTATNLIGLEGLVTVPVQPDTPRGKVKVQHQIWSAVSEGGIIPEHARVRIVRVDGVIVVVAPVALP
jgi:membrane-bound ClpP family serine protease